MTSTGPEVPGTRDRVLTQVRDATEPISAAEIAAALDLHVTTARFHLDHLEQAGSIARHTRRSGGRGRPTVGYRARGGDPEGAREDMITALAAALVDPEAARAAGRAWAARLPPPVGNAERAVLAEFDRIGFDPEPTSDGELLLRACPFRSAARAQSPVVCGTHLGLAQGIAERAEPGAVGVELRPFVQPDLCILALRPIGQ